MSSVAIDRLIADEGWSIHTRTDGSKIIIAEGEEFEYRHPALIHLKLYKDASDAESNYRHMKAAHDYLWPARRMTWSYWCERRFRAHCEGWEVMSWAGGASTGKSVDAAVVACLFWLAAPKQRAVMVMSTTLESLNSRIYGYVLKHLSTMAVPLPFKLYKGNNPKVVYPGSVDTTHCIAAVAAKKGDADAAISSLIGRHPEEGLMVIADEATDLPPAIMTAIPNLRRGVRTFQMLAIGNSKSKNDLHGALSTPAGGWESVDPLRDVRWQTTQTRGLCLFFSCYDSPAIHEADLAVRAAVSRFYMTAEEIEAKKKLYGEKSDSFYRFVLGFWRDDDADDVVISRKFLSAFKVRERAEWGGIAPLVIVAGLDPAFSTGGDDCMLRLAVLGQDVDGRVVLDYRGDELKFKVPILAGVPDAAEIQIARGVLGVLERAGCSLRDVSIDSSGQGRVLAELIKTVARVPYSAIKIVSTMSSRSVSAGVAGVLQGGGVKMKHSEDPDLYTMGNSDLWYAMRTFIEKDSIRGLDDEAISQLTSRLIKYENGKYSLESKVAYKLRMGTISPTLAHSPDAADAACLCLQTAILRYGFQPGQQVERVRRELSRVDEKMYLFREQARAIEESHGGRGHRVSPPIATFGVKLEDTF